MLTWWETEEKKSRGFFFWYENVIIDLRKKKLCGIFLCLILTKSTINHNIFENINCNSNVEIHVK